MSPIDQSVARALGANAHGSEDWVWTSVANLVSTPRALADHAVRVGPHAGHRRDFFWPLALLALLVLGVVAFAGFVLVSEFDAAAKLREESVVENGLQGRIHEAAEIAVAEVVWDAAVANLDNQFNFDWARKNVGVFFGPSRGFENSFVLAGDGTPLFAAQGGKPVGLERYSRFERDAETLVHSIRKSETHRGLLSIARAEGEEISAPIQASSMIASEGSIYLLTATLVQPDFGMYMSIGAHAPIVLTVMRADAAFLKTIADRHLLNNLHVVIGDSGLDRDEAHVILKTDQDTPIGALEWHPQNPGRVILYRLVLPVLVMLSGLAIGMLLLYRRASGMAEGLITSEARAARLAYYDPSTGLPNRVLFFDRLAQALSELQRTNREVAVHCVHLDRLKQINDTFGHHAGDELIQEAAKRMASQCRAYDTFSRLAGNEFAIVQTRASSAAGAALASRLNDVMSQPFDLKVGRVYASCSIGVSLIVDSRTEPAEALRQADLAQSRTRQTVKGQFCFYDREMDAAIKTRRAIEADLRVAVAQEAFHLVYQPQINEQTGMFGVEALVRWCHPERGNIPPALFIPIAEECGVIIELGIFILRRAFEDSKRWPDLRVAVNVSAKQLCVKDFATRVMALVDEVGVDPRQFEIEITEGILLGDDPQIHDMLQQLRNLGFSLALDDFGTGYSSLSYLQRYPINKIKIDRSFVANLGVRDDSQAVIDAIVSLARALGLSVIAEGVETAQQLERLCAAGCFEMQGYLFSRPVSSDEIDRMCEIREPRSPGVDV
jgi:diguanylate cyclase (GGDEF)-like protein